MNWTNHVLIFNLMFIKKKFFMIKYPIILMFFVINGFTANSAIANNSSLFNTTNQEQKSQKTTQQQQGCIQKAYGILWGNRSHNERTVIITLAIAAVGYGLYQQQVFTTLTNQYQSIIPQRFSMIYAKPPCLNDLQITLKNDHKTIEYTAESVHKLETAMSIFFTDTSIKKQFIERFPPIVNETVVNYPGLLHDLIDFTRSHCCFSEVQDFLRQNQWFADIVDRKKIYEYDFIEINKSI